MKAGAERLDVTSEELAALVEGVRAALGEAGYQKLQAAIRTLGYVTELLETRQATLDKLRRLLYLNVTLFITTSRLFSRQYGVYLYPCVTKSQ